MSAKVNTRTVTIVKTDAEKQMVWGEVYRPDTLDSQGDFMTSDQIERMAYAFMKSGKVNKIDTEHSLKENGCYVVESFLARPADPDFYAGSWVMGVWCPDKVWNLVKSGEINGFSMYGYAERVEKMVEVEVPDDGLLEGRVMKASDHDHEVVIKVDMDGNILGGETSKAPDGHFHKTRGGTTTEFAGVSEHSHRFSIGDLLAETVAKADKDRPGWREGKRTPDGKFSTAHGAAHRAVTSPDSHPHLHSAPTGEVVQ